MRKLCRRTRQLSTIVAARLQPFHRFVYRFSFDPLSFAMGFGSHMVSDAVGFHKNGGYLGSSVQSYVTTFSFMNSIDSLVMADYLQDSAEPWITSDANNFVANAGAYYRSINNQYPQFTSQQVAQCTEPWAETISSLLGINKVQVCS